MYELFTHIDSDKKNYLTLDDLVKLIEYVREDADFANKKAQEIMTLADLDDNGELDSEEFMMVTFTFNKC